MLHRRPLERERENANERKIARRASDKKGIAASERRTKGWKWGANGTNFIKSLFPSHFLKVKISKIGKILLREALHT